MLITYLLDVTSTWPETFGYINPSQALILLKNMLLSKVAVVVAKQWHFCFVQPLQYDGDDRSWSKLSSGGKPQMGHPDTTIRREGCEFNSQVVREIGDDVIHRNSLAYFIILNDSCDNDDNGDSQWWLAMRDPAADKPPKMKLFFPLGVTGLQVENVTISAAWES